MSDRFVIEYERRVVGIALRVAGGFRFFASSPDLIDLEARTFPNARAITRAVRRLRRAAAAGEAARRPSLATTWLRAV